MGRIQGGQNTECAECRVGRIQSVQSCRVGRIQSEQSTGWVEYRVGRVQGG